MSLRSREVAGRWTRQAKRPLRRLRAFRQAASGRGSRHAYLAAQSPRSFAICYSSRLWILLQPARKVREGPPTLPSFSTTEPLPMAATVQRAHMHAQRTAPRALAPAPTNRSPPRMMPVARASSRTPAASEDDGVDHRAQHLQDAGPHEGRHLRLQPLLGVHLHHHHTSSQWKARVMVVIHARQCNIPLQLLRPPRPTATRLADVRDGELGGRLGVLVRHALRVRLRQACQCLQ